MRSISKRLFMGVALATVLTATQAGSASAATSFTDGYRVRPDNVAVSLDLSDTKKLYNVASAPIKVAMPQGAGKGYRGEIVWEGLDHKLYSRDDYNRVHLVSSAYCLRPSTVTIGQVAWLACQGGYNQLWVTNLVTKDGRVATTGFKSMGGWFNGGAAITVKPGTREPMFVGTGGGTGSNVYTRTPSQSGWTRTKFFCKNRPEIYTNSIDSMFVCRGADDSVIAAELKSTGWTAARSLGGKTVSTPAFGTLSGGVGGWKVVVVGTNGYVYYKNYSGIDTWKSTGLPAKSISTGWSNFSQ